MIESPGSRRVPAACAWLAGCLGCLLLSACALRPELQTPRLSVAEIDILGSDLWQQRLRVRMHVQNPNERALAIKGLEYTLEVEGQPLASAESAESFTVPALGETDFDMNVTTHLAGALLTLLARGPDSLSHGVAYHIAGKVTLSEGWVRSIPFDQRGSFNVR